MAKILIVEDVSAFARVAESSISRLGNDVVMARDYRDAIERLLIHKPDGVITDVFFPSIWGLGIKKMGYIAVEKMRSSSGLIRDSPVTKAITKVGDLLGLEAAKIIAKTAHVDFRANVDMYWALEKAIEQSEANQPLGIIVAETAKTLNTPFVLVTSTYHHDILTQPVQDYVTARGWRLIDCVPGNEDTKTSPRFWETAYRALEERMN